MSNIRKRTGKNGVTYQVRYPNRSEKSGYAYKAFSSLKEARHYLQHQLPKHTSARHAEIRSIEQAVQKWLDTCEHEGRQGKDPVSPSTLENYKYRAEIIRAYSWDKELHELEAPDVVAFRSWLLKNYTRDQSQKVLSSFHSALLEMVTQGILTTDPASHLTIQQSRYKEPVRIPSVEEMQKILSAADQLAADKNFWIRQAWQRYRPMIYLAADSGMRPQEYLVLPISDKLENGVRITQALDGSNEIGPPKSSAGRRFIPVGLETLKMVNAYQKAQTGPNPDKLLFPGELGQNQTYNNYLRRGWYVLMEKSGMVKQQEVDGKQTTEMLYTPYSLRHFYASMLIFQKKDIKTIQERMGHKDAAMTLNVYGHLIRQKNAEQISEPTGILSGVLGTTPEFSQN